MSLEGIAIITLVLGLLFILWIIAEDDPTEENDEALDHKDWVGGHPPDEPPRL